jgi:hypothetical protein
MHTQAHLIADDAVAVEPGTAWRLPVSGPTRSTGGCAIRATGNESRVSTRLSSTRCRYGSSSFSACCCSIWTRTRRALRHWRRLSKCRLRVPTGQCDTPCGLPARLAEPGLRDHARLAYLGVFSIDPVSVAVTRTRSVSLRLPTAPTEFDLGRDCYESEVLGPEDVALCESVQRGIASRGYS